MTHKYSWIPDLPDKRDHYLHLVPPATLPSMVDLRPGCPAVYDQASLGSCTANAIAGLVEFDWMKQKKLKPFVPSRLFIYYNERVLENSVNTDAGAMLRDGIKTLNKWGFCDEKLWPYNIANFKKKPDNSCYLSAAKELVKDYARVPQVQQTIKAQIAAGFPIVFGFTVYESFESSAVAHSGHVPMPNLHKESVLGGHAVLIVGYDDRAQTFIVRNSWGPSWGDHGYFYMPYAYVLDSNLADDFWTVTFVP